MERRKLAEYFGKFFHQFRLFFSFVVGVFFSLYAFRVARDAVGVPRYPGQIWNRRP
jgi:hypothetical protein